MTFEDRSSASGDRKEAKDMRSLQDRCFLEIAKTPDQSLTPARVERALFSKQARQLIRRSTDHASSAESRLEGVSGRSSDYGAVGKGVNTVRLRQRIITQLVDEGRGMPGSFPAPPAFLDESFTSMSLAHSKIGDGFVQDTLSKRCPSLRSIDLTGCFYIRDASIEVLLQRCPHVERLCVQNCRKLTDASLRYMVRDGKKLSAVDIGGCFNLTAPGVDALCSIHPNVSRFTELDISGIAVTAQTLELMCKHCRILEALRMGFIEYMEATLIHTLEPLVSKIRSLHVHWNTCITDAFLEWAGNSLPRLQELNLCGCSHVSVEGVSALLYARQDALEKESTDQLSAIQSVTVRYTNMVKQDVEGLQASFPDIKIS